MDGWMDGWTYGHMDVRTDSPCILQDFVPFGAAAQKWSEVLEFALRDFFIDGLMFFNWSGVLKFAPRDFFLSGLQWSSVVLSGLIF